MTSPGGRARRSRNRLRSIGLAAVVGTGAFAACSNDGGSSVNEVGGSAISGDGEGSAAAWCDIVPGSDAINDIFDTITDDPADVAASLGRVEEYLGQMSQAAPAEIADDVRVLTESTQQLIDAFAAADFNVLDVDLSFLEDSATEARMNDANTAIDTYTERECGRPFGDEDTAGADPDSTDAGDLGDLADLAEDSGVFDPSAGTIRDQLIAQFESIGLTTEEAECIADNLDFSDPAVQSGDIAAVLGLFETCDIDMGRLAELGG